MKSIVSLIVLSLFSQYSSADGLEDSLYQKAVEAEERQKKIYQIKPRTEEELTTDPLLEEDLSTKKYRTETKRVVSRDPKTGKKVIKRITRKFYYNPGYITEPDGTPRNLGSEMSEHTHNGVRHSHGSDGLAPSINGHTHVQGTHFHSDEEMHKARWGASSPQKRRYFSQDPRARVDAGKFFVGFGAGGNISIEPKFASGTRNVIGRFTDPGFQANVYLDYDYFDMPLGLRGIVSYQRILKTINVFGAEALVRYLPELSEKARFSVGAGVALNLLMRDNNAANTQNPGASILRLAFILHLGIDFNPFLIDIRAPIYEVGEITFLSVLFSAGIRI